MVSQVICGTGLLLILLQISLSHAKASISCEGKTNCISLPKDCKLDSCDLVAKLERKGDTVSFQVEGKVSAESYVAVGLSKDDSMGKDAVVACLSDGVKTFINPGGKTATETKIWKSGSPTNLKSGHDENHLSCSFDLPNKVDAGDEISFDLSEQVNILLVGGSVSAEKKLQYHSTFQATGIFLFGPGLHTKERAAEEKSMASSNFGHVSSNCFVILSIIVAVYQLVPKNWFIY